MSLATTLVNPYPGLAPFDERDSARFFGRDREIDDVLDRLAARRLLAVIGVSGSGKSSLLRAGVIPVLRIGVAENLPTHFRICTLTPGNGPLRALAAAVGADGTWPATSFDLVDHARKTLQAGESLLLLVDQFEELFRYRADTMAQDGGNAASLFVNLLLNAVDQREIPIYVLLTMRTDFLGECAQFRGLPEALNDCYYLVPRMTRLQQQDAIEKPLKEMGVAMHPALVQQLLNDSAEDPDHLPVLQHLLKRLWESWRERGTDAPISIEDYEAVGGWKEALDRDAENVLGLFPAEEDRIRLVFQWTTERGHGEKPIPRPRMFSECAVISGLGRERLGEILGKFQERGLLKPSTGTEDWLVEVPHESVMWQWSRLNRWIAEEAERGAQVRFILQSARQQMQLTGLTLDSSLKLRSDWREQDLLVRRYVIAQEQKDVEEWIDRSEAIEKQRLLAEIEVRVDRAQRTSAEARELSAWAKVSLNEDPERSLILGLYSWGKQRAMVGGLEQVLHSAVLQSASRLTLYGHQNWVMSVAWSPDGTKLATASVDNTAGVWEADSGWERLTLHGHQNYIWSIAWSPDGSKLATASEDKTAKVWDAGTGHELLILCGHQNGITSVAWSPDGSKLATASHDKTAKVWESRTGRELLTLGGHQSPVWSIAWSPDGSMLATASDDNTGKVWDAGTGCELFTLRGHVGPVMSIAWSPDGTMLATASGDDTAKVWEVGTGRDSLTLRGHQFSVMSIGWSPDGSKLATASADNTAKVWEAGAGRELLNLRGHQTRVWSIAWSPDGSKLATASADNTARVWDVGRDHELLTIRGHQNLVSSITWSPDGSKLATASADKTAKVWGVGTGRELLTLHGHQHYVVSVAWSPDGSMLATASADNSAKVWEVGTGRELLTLRGHQEAVTSITWSPDGSKLATASADNSAKVWEVGTGRELLTLRGHHQYVMSVAWSPDGSMLATASADSFAKVWEARTGRELLTLRGHQNAVESIAWSPDGSKLATASDDSTAKVWEAITGRELLTLRGHQNSVVSIAWSPDGSKLATASDDSTVMVWEAGTGRELLTLRGHQGSVVSIAWSPDGSKLATASQDKTAQVYAITEAELLRLVRSRITRDLTSDECARYLNTDRCPPLPEVP